MSRLSDRILQEMAEWNEKSRQNKTWKFAGRQDVMDEELRLQVIAGGYLYEHLSHLLPSQVQDSEFENAAVFKQLTTILSWLSKNPELVEQVIQGANYQRLAFEIRRRGAMKQDVKRTILQKGIQA